MFMDLWPFGLLGANSSKRKTNENFCRREVLVESKKYFSLKVVQNKGKQFD